jgi:hypothetical protein
MQTSKTSRIWKYPRCANNNIAVSQEMMTVDSSIATVLCHLWQYGSLFVVAQNADGKCTFWIWNVHFPSAFSSTAKWARKAANGIMIVWWRLSRDKKASDIEVRDVHEWCKHRKLREFENIHAVQTTILQFHKKWWPWTHRSLLSYAIYGNMVAFS